MTKVKITYFKPSGKYYTSGEYESEHDAFHLVIDEVCEMFRNDKNPGMYDSARARNEFDALVECFGIPYLIKAHKCRPGET